jgi:hypothetical protein
MTVVSLTGEPPSAFSGKQLAAVMTHAGATSAPLHARPSAVSLAAKP